MLYEKSSPYFQNQCEKDLFGHVRLGQQSCSCHVPPPHVTVSTAVFKKGLGVNTDSEMACFCSSTLLSLAYAFLTVDWGVYIGLQNCFMFGVFV